MSSHDTEVSSPRTILFTDLRHIRCGDLSWRSPDGEPIDVLGSGMGPVEARADLGMVPRGVRLQAKEAEKMDPDVGTTAGCIERGA